MQPYVHTARETVVVVVGVGNQIKGKALYLFDFPGLATLGKKRKREDCFAILSFYVGS